MASGPNQSGAEDNAPLPTSPSDFMPRSVQESWFRYRDLLRQGESEAARQTFKTLKQQATDLGIDNLDVLSAVLLVDAKAALEKGDADLALEMAGDAQELSANYPAAYFFRGRVLLRYRPWKFLEAIGEYLAGWTQSGRHIWVLLYDLANGLLWFVWAAGAAGLVFILTAIVRFAPRLSHVLYEICRRNVNRWILSFSTAVLLVGPLWLGLGILWVLLWCLLLFWVFMTGREKTIALIVVFLMASSGHYLSLWMSLVKARDSETFVIMARAVRGEAGISPGIVRFADGEKRATDQQDWQALMSRGLQYKRSVQYDLAQQHFEQALKAKPDEARIVVNLGNVYFLTNRLEEAIRTYQRALQFNPHSVEAHYNLAQAYREKLLFDEGAREYKEAERLNLAQTERYTRRALEALSHPVVDAPLTLSETIKRAITINDTTREMTEGVLYALWNLPTRGLPLIGIGFIAMALLLSRVFNRREMPFPCSLCGRTVCPRCQKHLFHLRTCEDCMEANKKVKKLIELKQVQERQERLVFRARLLSVLLPGLGHFFLLQTLKGFLYAFLFFSFIFVGFMGDVRFWAAYGWISAGPGLVFFTAIAGLILVYLIVLWDLGRIQLEWEG
jgi:tetratricopeptide (TPR) repeat protein